MSTKARPGSTTGARFGLSAEPGWTSEISGGFLFRRVQVPRDVEIGAAHLELVQRYQADGAVRLLIRGEAVHQADDFGPGSAIISSRPRTLARVPWELAERAYGWVNSPDIAGVIQEIVDMPGWWPGNNLAIFLDPQSPAYTTWSAYEAGPEFAARLVVSYTWRPLATETPTVTPTPAVSASQTPTATPEESTPTPTPGATQRDRSYLPLILR